MEYFDSEYFNYKNGELYCENVPVKKIAGEFGTPTYIYSRKFFVDRYTEFNEAFKEIPHTIFFAAKANFNLNVIKTFVDLGSGVDVNSAGELYRALKAGADPKNMILTGVGKTEEEIELGLKHGVKMIKAESLQEAYLINKVAERMDKIAPVAFRVNPDVDARTHPYISTGLAENKFGIDGADAYDMFIECSKLSNIRMTGIDMHIGSQITEVDPYVEAVDRLSELFFKLKEAGVPLEHFDLGGGYGVVYKDENYFPIKKLAEVLLPKLKNLGCEILFEPGRYMTANGGILVTKVLYTKSNRQNKNFIVVDAAMNDLLRPSIYGAYHHVQPVVKNNSSDITADVVGPVCESGDFMAKNRVIEKCEQGDLLSVMTAGAYGWTMASNYNARRRPPEIIAADDKYFVARGRENYDYLLFDEKIIQQLHNN